MPYTAEHKARTRERIVDAARSQFNRRGFDSVSIEDIMSHAGLTRGGFYNHFASKADLFVEAVISYVTSSPMHRRMMASKRPPPPPMALARQLVDLYLSDEVLDDPDNHCPLYALPGESARGGDKPRAAYTAVIRSLQSVFVEAFQSTCRKAMHNSQLIITLCVGGMVLARTTDDPALSKSLRAAARRQCHALLDEA